MSVDNIDENCEDWSKKDKNGVRMDKNRIKRNKNDQKISRVKH